METTRFLWKTLTGFSPKVTPLSDDFDITKLSIADDVHNLQIIRHAINRHPPGPPISYENFCALVKKETGDYFEKRKEQLAENFDVVFLSQIKILKSKTPRN